MSSNNQFVVPSVVVEPLAVSIEGAMAATDESRSTVYNLIGTGEYEAVKAGSKTLILYESIKRRLAKLPRAQIKPPKPKPRRGPPPAKAGA
jgi:hypothetical protein